jgi:hypothetical protein
MMDFVMERAGFLGRFDGAAHDESGKKSVIYGVVPSKVDLRWLIPLTNTSTTAASFSLYQPSLARARFLKKMAILSARVGITGLIFRDRVYFKPDDGEIRKIFGRDDLQYAIFSGTKGTHRKITVQVMDGRGAILGYIKVSDSEEIDQLLKNEAMILNKLSALKVAEGFLPKVLFSGAVNGTNVMLLDSLKDSGSKFSSRLSEAHITFLAEMCRKTAGNRRFRESRFYHGLVERVARLSGATATTLKERMTQALDYLDGKMGEEELPFGICHRDFTPWNTFFHGAKLFVFDWEYAKEEYPPLLDIYHFIVQDGIIVRKMTPGRLLGRISEHKSFIETYCNMIGIQENLINPLLLCYLLDISLLYLERGKGDFEASSLVTVATWGQMMDMVMTGL